MPALASNDLGEVLVGFGVSMGFGVLMGFTPIMMNFFFFARARSSSPLKILFLPNLSLSLFKALISYLKEEIIKLWIRSSRRVLAIFYSLQRMSLPYPTLQCN